MSESQLQMGENLNKKQSDQRVKILVHCEPLTGRTWLYPENIELTTEIVKINATW